MSFFLSKRLTFRISLSHLGTLSTPGLENARHFMSLPAGKRMQESSVWSSKSRVQRVISSFDLRLQKVGSLLQSPCSLNIKVF